MEVLDALVSKVGIISALEILKKGKTWKRKVGFSKNPWIFRVQLLFSLVWECFFDQGDKSLRSGNK